jgi:hypothetical protein
MVAQNIVIRDVTVSPVEQQLGIAGFLKSIQPRRFHRTMSKQQMLDVIAKVCAGDRVEVQFRTDGFDGLDHLHDLYTQDFLWIELVSSILTNSALDKWALAEDRIIRFTAGSEWDRIQDAFLCNVFRHLEAVTILHCGQIAAM